MAICRDCVHYKLATSTLWPFRCENPDGNSYLMPVDFPWCSRIFTKRHEELVAEAMTLLTAIPSVGGFKYEACNGDVTLRVHTSDEGRCDTIDAIVKVECALIDKFPGIYIDLDIV